MTEQHNGEIQGLILIVDDTPSNINLLSSILTSGGHDVYFTDNGNEALEMTHAMLPDLILLDIHIPEMDGFEICRRLKRDSRTRDIPVIFISAVFDQIDDMVRGFDVGGVDYIITPFRFQEVIARVKNHLTLVRQRQQLKKMHEQDREHFEALDKMKTEFVNRATHDLKNPLNIILGFSDLLRDVRVVDAADEHMLEQAISSIQISCQQMQLLVTDMLDLFQMETRVNLSLKPVSLSSFLATCIRGYEPVARQKQIELVLNLPADEVTITLDEARMRRVMDNLVSNAIKYTPEGGCVEVSAEVDRSQAVIKVFDNGLGIPEKDIPHLFEAFYRVSQRSHMEIEGTGLGLSIVKSIVEQHNGEIFVESELGQGSMFAIVLPLA